MGENFDNLTETHIYSSYPRWILIATDEVISIIPKKPNWFLYIFTFFSLLTFGYMFSCFIFKGNYLPFWLMLFVAPIGVAMFCFSDIRQFKKGACMICDKKRGKIDLPHLNVSLYVDEIVKLQQISGTAPSGEYLTELNIIAKNKKDALWRWICGG